MMVSAHCCARRCCRQDFKKRAWWFWKRQGLMWRVWLFQACSTTSTVWWCKCVWMCWLIGAWKKTKQNNTVDLQYSWMASNCDWPFYVIWHDLRIPAGGPYKCRKPPQNVTRNESHAATHIFFFLCSKDSFCHHLQNWSNSEKKVLTEAIDGCQGPACKQATD